MKDNESYKEGIVVDEDNSYTLSTKGPSKVLIGDEIVLKKSEKIFDNTNQIDL